MKNYRNMVDENSHRAVNEYLLEEIMKINNKKKVLQNQIRHLKSNNYS